jgi:hypothetical protein
MRRADGAGRAAAEGLVMAGEIVAGVRPLVQGLQISIAAGAAAFTLDMLETIHA